MLSFQDLVNELLSGIEDPQVRMQIAQTLMLIKDAYVKGHNEEEVRAALIDVIKDVLLFKGAVDTVEEAVEKAKEYAEKMLAAIKVQNMYQFTRVRLPFRI